jgi:phage shock protein C
MLVLPGPEPAEAMEAGVAKRLYRSRNERMVWGVCGGLAEYFGLDPTVIRVIWVVGLVVGIFPVTLAYIILAIIIPVQPEEVA